jgi:hypothetical protein
MHEILGQSFSLSEKITDKKDDRPIATPVTRSLGKIVDI